MLSYTRLLVSHLILALTIFSLQAIGAELRGTPEELRQYVLPQKNRVTLQTKVEKTTYADRAIVNLLITTEDDKLSLALTKSNKIKTDIRSKMQAAGVKAGDINTSKFSSTPQYGWFGNEPDSYEIVARIAVKISTAEQFQQIASLVDQYKEVQLGSINYKHSEKDSVKRELRRQALQKIAQIKKDYEQALGVKLKAIRFSDSELGLQPTLGAQEAKMVVTGSRVKRSRSTEKYAESMPAAPQVDAAQSFDEVAYKLDMWVEYEVEE